MKIMEPFRPLCRCRSILAYVLSAAAWLGAAYSLAAQSTPDCPVPDPLQQPVGCREVNCADHHAEHVFEQDCRDAQACDAIAVREAYRRAIVVFSWFNVRSDFQGFVKKVSDKDGATYLGCRKDPLARIELTRGALAEGAHYYDLAYKAYIGCSKKPPPGDAEDPDAQAKCAAKAIQLFCVIHSDDPTCQTGGGQQTLAMTIGDQTTTTTTTTTGGYNFDSAIDSDTAAVAAPKPQTNTLTVQLPSRDRVAALRNSMTAPERDKLKSAVNEKSLALTYPH